jgi:hypothetical protein
MLWVSLGSTTAESGGAMRHHLVATPLFHSWKKEGQQAAMTHPQPQTREELGPNQEQGGSCQGAEQGMQNQDS